MTALPVWSRFSAAARRVERTLRQVLAGLIPSTFSGAVSRGAARWVWSSASPAHLITWNGSKQIAAWGKVSRVASGRRGPCPWTPPRSCPALFAERLVKLVECALRAALADPHHPAGVVVGHDREELAAFVGDLVDPDAREPVKAVGVQMLPTRRRTMASTVCQEVRSSTATLLLAIRCASHVPCPRSRWCAGHPAAPTAPTRCGPARNPGSRPGGFQLPASPSTPRSRHAATAAATGHTPPADPPTRTDQQRRPQPHPDHDRSIGKRHGLDHRSPQAQKTVEYSSDAHVRLLDVGWLRHLPNEADNVRVSHIRPKPVNPQTPPRKTCPQPPANPQHVENWHTSSKL